MKRIHQAAVLFFVFMAISAHVSAADPVKMVVTAAFVSAKGVSVYEDIAAYMTKKSGLPVKVISGLSYSEAEAMLISGDIQVGFICGFSYIKKAADGSVSLLAIPVMSLKAGTFPGAPGYEKIPGKYYSYTIVKKGSSIKSWDDLKGKTYAYNDTASNSGYNLPRYKLISLGADWSYFSKVIQSDSHEESIRLVALGMVDASSVDSLVLDYERSIGDKYAADVEIIDVLGPSGTPPAVISPKADPSLKPVLTGILTGMHHDPEGQKILAKGLLLRFDPPDDANYNDIREMDQMARDKGFKDLP